MDASCTDLRCRSAFDPAADDSPLLAGCYAASVGQRVATGERAGQRVRRVGRREGQYEARLGPRHGHVDGFDLHADIEVPAWNTLSLERLLRYCARPALSHDRLSVAEAGQLLLELKTP